MYNCGGKPKRQTDLFRQKSDRKAEKLEQVLEEDKVAQRSFERDKILFVWCEVKEKWLTMNAKNKLLRICTM